MNDKFQICSTLKLQGLRQWHTKTSRYFLTPTLIIDFETAHDIYQANKPVDKGYDEISFSEHLTYIPILEDLFVFLGDKLYQVRLSPKGHGWEAHSAFTLNEKNELSDRIIVDNQPDQWSALAKLCLAVNSSPLNFAPNEKSTS